MSELIDSVVKTDYNYGFYFPFNARIIGFVFVPFGLILSIYIFESVGFGILGLVLLIFGLVIVLSRYGTKIDIEKELIIEYILFLGLIEKRKVYPLGNYLYITVIPAKHTSTVYSRSSNYTTQTQYYFTVCLLNVNYRNKLEIAKFDQRSEAIDIAKKLGSTIHKAYFDYDPQIIREKLLGLR